MIIEVNPYPDIARARRRAFSRGCENGFVAFWFERVAPSDQLTATSAFSCSLDCFEDRKPLLSNLGRVGQPNPLTHDGLIVEKISKRNSVEHIVDLLLEQHPDRANAAQVRRRAAITLDGMADAVEIERLELGSLNHFPDRRLRRRLCERVPTASSTRALDHARAAKTEQDLLYVVSGKFFPLGNVTAIYGALARAPREMKRADDAILSPCRYAHAAR
jgi:hypothetical protein